ncbi:tRNA (N(6)-L-threonylcarbamoyladenosine(37)-C(2))-methylthiotransferase MtaB [Hyphobacterium sp. HN65]|uniref:tRNA (N(6)-L-threonylcarbamoyladenosine(37)-C(2))-methylthiotransferase MtaB n=1 Tax=Hyphobacterium lacteum TaxID=3116575 RepID=A0ABU7LS63_9PROT|nr:tRNA (N(6)-L-threonylcarbamoyladenosine(37)-C(2))-methylthiotransferase MtaB [Hyphobacterium sp. HN65]MEE2526757.1 tRNA (N(6)-L-threonylcarbamoyladenosine(37)-C(2))-methylthiotransferase MtaB [Hyphobacterium sp. HN65]
MSDQDVHTSPEQPETQGANEIHTFGCRLNSWESEVMRGHAEAAGLEGAIIFNTCAVTSEAVRQARQAIRRARRANPDAPIIVTGCAAQVNPGEFADMPEVTRVIGNAEKMKAETFKPQILLGGSGKQRVSDIMKVREVAGHLVDGLDGRARAYVQVQTGCDHRCTFCIIPYGRGDSRSVPAGEVVEQVRTLVGNGFQEIVLTGVDLTSWGADLPGQPKLGRLVQSILKQSPDLPQLRLSSIDAIEIDDALFETITSEQRIAPHLHLSLQAGSDMILKRMKRRHLRDDAIRLCTRLKQARPDIAFGADLIAGFPTETEDMFAQTLDLVEACDLAYIHAFPFSPRPGTPAARMPQLDRAIVKQRAARLRDVAAAALDRHLSGLVGSIQTGLVEKPGFARAPNFAGIRLTQTPARAGALLPVRITGHDGRELLGEPA